jgi:hypothetical protein
MRPNHKRGNSVDMQPAWPMAPKAWADDVLAQLARQAEKDAAKKAA